MHVTLVRISIKVEHREEFIEATRMNHEASVRESGNRRFDVLEDHDDPSRFLLHEWYDTAEQATAHRETEHFFLWRDTVAGMMAKPRESEVFTALHPRW
jgi:autoinducer 2-degrading protein